MKNRLLKIERWLLRMMVPVLLVVGLAPAVVYAGLGDSKHQVEERYGAAYFIQDETKQIWTRQEWQTGTHGKAVAYGYWSNAGKCYSTHWVEYDKQEKAVKETVLFGTELRIRDFRQYFKMIHDALAKENSIVFTKRFFSGDTLGAVVQADNNKLIYIRFLLVPDSTKINIHSKISGFEITETTPQAIKRHFADKTWRKTDNYFEDKLYFSETLVPRRITDMIVIHHTAMDDMSVDDIHELHLTKGWAGIGYHKVILPDGTVLDGRPEGMIGAHALGANPRSIGIVLDGDYEDRPPKSAQMDSLVKLTHALMEKYHIPLEHVVPHRDVTEGTSCPGKQFPWAELIHRLGNKDEDIVKNSRGGSVEFLLQK
jgi:hypothetical protein